MFEFDPKEKVVKISDGSTERQVQLISSTVTNKFFIVENFINNLLKMFGDEFSKWYFNMISEYQDNMENRLEILENNIPIIKKYVDDYILNSGLDFNKHVDLSKAKKTSILFMPDEIEKIIKLSSYLKLIAIFSNSKDKLNQNQYKKIYNLVADDVSKSDIAVKIFDLIKTKTFRYNLTDKSMWDYIMAIRCKSIDIHVVEIFNFVMNSILILCEEDKNPITYFIGVTDESVKWFLRSVYKDTIVYEDSISTEDIYTPSTDNLKTYTYNSGLGRIKGVSYELIYDTIEKESSSHFDSKNEDLKLLEFQTRIGKSEFISPLCECLTFPVLSKITNIPYVHFKTLSPEHSAVVSILVSKILQKVFDNEYKNLFTLLEYYPTASPALMTTYTIKSVKEYIEKQNDSTFFGFKTKVFLYNTLSYFIGRISRAGFYHTITGAPLPGIPLTKIESEMIEYFSDYFSGKLDDKFDKMKYILNSYL